MSRYVARKRSSEMKYPHCRLPKDIRSRRNLRIWSERFSCSLTLSNLYRSEAKCVVRIYVTGNHSGRWSCSTAHEKTHRMWRRNKMNIFSECLKCLSVKNEHQERSTSLLCHNRIQRQQPFNNRHFFSWLVELDTYGQLRAVASCTRSIPQAHTIIPRKQCGLELWLWVLVDGAISDKDE